MFNATRSLLDSRNLNSCNMLLSNKHRLFPLPTGLDTKLFALGPHHICHFFTSLPYFAWIHKRHTRIRPYFPGQMITYYWPLLHSGFRRVFHVRVRGRSFILPSIVPYFTLGWPQAIWLNYLHGMVARNIHQVVG